jgi:hypothetical protein
LFALDVENKYPSYLAGVVPIQVIAERWADIFYYIFLQKKHR